MPLILAPATITKLRTLDQGELRSVQLTLPDSLRVGTKEEPIEDGMRPGAAFLAEPFGEHNKRREKRLYMRSNCSISAQRRLETLWWQTGEIHEGDTIGVQVDSDPKGTFLKVHEHRILDKSKSLALEPDTWWSEQNFVAVAFSTGMTPFLAHIRYMALFEFGRAFRRFESGAHYVLIVSVRNPLQLMCHDELRELEDRFPDNFRYHPVLTREWPDDWPYTRQRIIKTEDGAREVDLSALLSVVPDIGSRHVRICGGKAATEQLVRGLREYRITPRSIKAEVW
ncbi:MAG TPA: hypothetical protein VE422_21950 [Terriglobia bacterium]|nr:hypothetical protein [Terriglobia bacterium]